MPENPRRGARAVDPVVQEEVRRIRQRMEDERRAAMERVNLGNPPPQPVQEQGIEGAVGQFVGQDGRLVNAAANPGVWFGWDAAAAAAVAAPLMKGTQPAKKSVREIKGDTKVSDLFLLKGPSVQRKAWGYSLPVAGEKFPYDAHIGLEIEVEGAYANDDNIAYYFHQVPDNSLRNEGREYVSNLGLTAGEVITGVKLLDAAFKAGKKRIGSELTNSFSFRCGLHVHTNMTDHTLEEIYRLFLVYTVAEGLLFNMSGNRNTNKFCVSIQQSLSALGEAVNYGHARKWADFQRTFRGGSKYMALNILPVTRFGSFEFRHHEGTSDPEKIKNWLLVLCDLVYHSRELNTEQLEKEILSLNTESKYDNFLTKCFPHSVHLLRQGDYKREMYSGVAFLKEQFLGCIPLERSDSLDEEF